MEFLKSNWLELSFLFILFLIALIYVVWQIKKNGLRGAVVSLIVEAEKEFNNGDNEKKINYVIDSLIKILPLPFNILITRETIRKFIQKIFDETKKALDYKK